MDTVPGYERIQDENPTGSVFGPMLDEILGKGAALHWITLTANLGADVGHHGRAFDLDSFTLLVDPASVLEPGWYCWARGPGTIDPDDGSNVTLASGEWAVVGTDGTTTFILKSGSGGGGGGSYTNEEAQDAVGGILNDGGDIDFTYNDATPSITADVKANAVGDTKLRDSAALSVIGRSANSGGDPADIAAGTDGHVLRRAGTSLGFGALAAGAFPTGPGIVTPGMLDNGSALSILGRAANSSGARADIAAANDGEVLRRSGTSVGFGTIATAGIGDDQVTNAKQANMATGTIKARGTGSTGDPEDISVGTNLTLDANSLRSTKTSVNTQTGSYTLVAADEGKVVEMNVAGANDMTVPPNSSVAFPVGTVINVSQLGAGQTTVVQGSGVTIRSRNGLKLAGQYAAASLYKRATDEWLAAGDLAT